MFGEKKTKIYLIATLIILFISIKISLTNRNTPISESINRAISDSQVIYNAIPEQRKAQMVGSVVKLSYFSEQQSYPGDKDYGLYRISTATGFSIGYDEYTDSSFVITNDHFCEKIIDDETAILLAQKSDTAIMSDDDQDGMLGEIINTSMKDDLCITRIFGRINGSVLANKEYRPKQFERLYIIGAPSGILPIIVETFYSADIPRDKIFINGLMMSSDPLLMTSEMILPGHSGSPIFNKDGEVIGVIFASLSSYGGVGVPVKDIYNFIEETIRLKISK